MRIKVDRSGRVCLLIMLSGCFSVDGLLVDQEDLVNGIHTKYIISDEFTGLIIPMRRQMLLKRTARGLFTTLFAVAAVNRGHIHEKIAKILLSTTS